MTTRSLIFIASLALAACGGASKNEAAASAEAAANTDAATVEAVRDTDAATADAMKAADAELDNLGNSIDDGAPIDANKVSRSTKVTTY